MDLRWLRCGGVSAIEELCKTVARLRGPGGCPWDQEQDHRSLADCLMEECCELLDTLDRLDFSHMKEELGDVLLQVIFHAHLAEESGHFALEDVARATTEKLIRRHPHVFGDVVLETSEQVLHQWERIKATEKQPEGMKEGLFKRLPRSLPALLFARDVFKQMEKDRMPWEEVCSADRIGCLADGMDEAQAGLALFELAAACRRAGVDPESALRRHTLAVMQAVEDGARAAGGRK